MKVKAKLKDGVTRVKVLAKHPMETGRRKDKFTGELIPPHYIRELSCQYQDKPVFVAYMGTAVSKDPYLSFSFNGGQSGDTIVLQWVDDKGESLSKEAVIK